MAAPFRLAFAILCFTLSAALAPASASDAVPGTDGAITIRLNQTEAQPGACRMMFLAQNALGDDIERLVLEVVLFDRAHQVAAITLLDFQSLPLGRSRLRSFDLAGRDCADLARLLVNGVSECSGAGLAAPRCEAALDVGLHDAVSPGLEIVQ